MRKYYGYLYTGGKYCSTEDTLIRGKYHRAGGLFIFKSQAERQRWLNEEHHRGQGSGLREAVTRAQAIKLVGLKWLNEEIDIFENHLI